VSFILSSYSIAPDNNYFPGRPFIHGLSRHIFTIIRLHPDSPTGPPPHRANVAPGHLAEAEQEPHPDHLRQLVLGDRDEPERFVEADQLQSIEAHVQFFIPAGVDLCLHDEPGKPLANGTLPR